MTKPLDLAIKTEKDGIDFYTNAAEETDDELGKKMFLSFIEDEKRHLEILEKISCEEYVCIEDIEDYSPKENLKTVFSEMPDDVKKKSLNVRSDLEALNLALDMERLGYDQYIKASKGTDDEEHKKIYKKLAEEEKEHYELLLETKSYLEDTGNWYMWYEHKFPT